MSGPSVVEDIFLAALEKGTPEERAAFLDAACKDDSDLRRRVERLLEAHPKAGGFLEGPARPAGEETAAYVPAGEQVGAVIAGRYKLLEQIGEGGMGTVWVAEQTQPVRRKVALKLIKAGMDSKAVLARFEAERQALALMDHPNIAKVLDGGTTEGGRPFFVMEYVKGVPFTRYCDDARLSVAQRLALFMPICQAVQHAHQKGIIHRDLKPSNILVCLYDGVPVPKVIDFGLAKAMHQPLTEHTLHTAHGVMMGTPLYMSPEQAEFNNLDVDTRTDIYALGVILYELLTGTTPLEKQRFKEAAWHEMLRLIKEEEPPRPSARLSGSRSLPSLAAQRQLEPVKLTKLVRGELDWIVMKCLEKDRSRRYETVNGFAADVQRYLAGETVQAHPPTTAYRIRKFAHKHRVGLSTTLAFVVVLAVATVVSTLLAFKATRAEALAENRRNEAEASANEAQEKSQLLAKESAAHFAARIDAEITAKGLQIDIDLAETHHDQRVGMLRMVEHIRQGIGRVKVKLIPIGDDADFLEPDVGMFTDKNGNVTVYSREVYDGPDGTFKALREFVTAAVLATGQDYASLLRPITHDGIGIRSSSFTSTGLRLLTLGLDKTTRLWDPFTGRQIAILRHKQEQVIDVGLSPDGATAFTHSLDGVVRLWETKDGAFRAQNDPRPGRVKPFIRLSNDRLLTYEEGLDSKAKAPVELWDAKTGRFIAQLGLPKGYVSYVFFGNGRWIGSYDGFGWEKILLVFSAENGHLVAKLKNDEKYGSSRRVPVASPSGSTVATVSETKRSGYYVHLWNTTSWQLLSTTGPFREGDIFAGQPEFQFVADDLFMWTTSGDTTGVFRPASATPIAELPGSIAYSLRDRVVLGSGQLFDSRTWRRLQPPKGRKYHPEITRFAPDGRFVPVTNYNEGIYQFLDTTTEKTFLAGSGLVGSGPSFYQARLGWVGGWVGFNDNGSEIALHRLPPPDRLDIPPDLLELWAQVAVRGQLDGEGAFVKWDEPTWEKKRRELAAKPVPYPDFPFPGHVAGDQLHWLRQEYANASDADKPRLAKQLLDRAEVVGDKAEAVRWRALLTPAPATKPAASK